MQTLTRLLLDEGLNDRIITESQLSRLIEGSDQRRYHLVNRAMKSGELNRLARGVYLLADSFRDNPCHPFSLAQMLVPSSYVSFETALSHHAWIPEAVYTTASVVADRKSRKIRHEKYGSYTFHPLVIGKGYFLELVESKQINRQTMLVANPARALMDLVCLRKKDWQGLEWLIDGLRVEYEYLRTVTNADIRILKYVYKQKRVKVFLDALARELGND